jgi:hypothetical protein
MGVGIVSSWPRGRGDGRLNARLWPIWRRRLEGRCSAQSKERTQRKAGHKLYKYGVRHGGYGDSGGHSQIA